MNVRTDNRQMKFRDTTYMVVEKGHPQPRGKCKSHAVRALGKIGRGAGDQ